MLVVLEKSDETDDDEIETITAIKIHIRRSDT